MNPVVGLDIAKGKSQVQAYLEKKKPYKSSFKVAHTLEGLDKLLFLAINCCMFWQYVYKPLRIITEG